MAARLLVAVYHHVIADPRRERRAFERRQRRQDHRDAALHIGGAGTVQHAVLDPGQRLERVVGREHRVHMAGQRSEEHTSELQSLMRISYSVFCLKNTNTNIIYSIHSLFIESL